MNRGFFILLVVLVLPLMSFVSAHKFYVSVTEMEYKPEKKSLQIITRIFTDDFEDVLKARYSKDVFITKEEEHPKAEAYISNYVNQKIRVKVNGKFQELEYLGKEYENDMVLLYIEAKDVPFIENIEVQNSLLYGLFPEQKNIVHIEVGENIKSLLLHRSEDSGTINF